MEMKVNHRLYRSRGERMLAGVAGGVADYLDVDPTLVRLGFLVAFVATGPVAVFAYLGAALIIPSEPATTLV
jgi:phage shock protein C